MRSAIKALVVGAVAGSMLLIGIATANASTVAPTPAAATSTVAAPAVVVPASHSGLYCRSHTSESKPVSGKVVVPKSYCYDPSTSNHTGWHDYCTHSPDQYNGIGGTADFRGPCARHDMCLQAGHSHGTCDGPLLSNLKQNCKQRFGTFDPRRYDCEKVAYEYYLVIKIYTHL
ncbi:MAG: hypothetical protein ACR2P2_06000 [Nakamurella sp.]